MAVAEEITQIGDGLWFWQAYDSAVKADLSSCAVLTSDGLVLVDPIELAPAALAELTNDARIAAIVITNSNHQRSSEMYQLRFNAPLVAHSETIAACELCNVNAVSDRETIASELLVVAIDGAPSGEIALYLPRGGGSMIIGDAVINFGSSGFALLPPKYCSNQKQMRRSLRRLLDRDFERMFFAHGTPVLRGAKERLQALVDD